MWYLAAYARHIGDIIQDVIAYYSLKISALTRCLYAIRAIPRRPITYTNAKLQKIRNRQAALFIIILNYRSSGPIRPISPQTKRAPCQSTAPSSDEVISWKILCLQPRSNLPRLLFFIATCGIWFFRLFLTKNEKQALKLDYIWRVK